MLSDIPRLHLVYVLDLLWSSLLPPFLSENGSWSVVGHVLATLACCTCTLDSSCSCTCFLSSDAPEYRPHTLELRSSRENCDMVASIDTSHRCFVQPSPNT